MIADKIILTLLLIIIMATISIWKMIFMEDDFVTNVAAFLYIISLTCILIIWI